MKTSSISLKDFERSRIPSQGVLTKIKFKGCNPGDQLTLCVIKKFSDELDSKRCVRDALWKIEAKNSPVRYARFFKGSESLIRFLTKYTILDGNSCSYNIDTSSKALRNIESTAEKTNVAVNFDKIKQSLTSRPPVFIYENARLMDSAHTVESCYGIIDKIGIPQPSEISGLCWWGSLWFASSFPQPIFDILNNHVRKSVDNETCNYLKKVISDVLVKPSQAEKLRRFLYSKHKIGDDPSQHPSLDGQNGYSQLSILCTVIDFPLVTVVAPWMKIVDMRLESNGHKFDPPRKPLKGEKCLLGIRNYRSKWKPPEYIELKEMKGRRWRLQSCFIGSEWCGHQVSLARACDTNHWFLYDSDGVRIGIGPISWKTSSHEEWWKTLQAAIPFSNDSVKSKFCDVNPQNMHPLHIIHELLRAEGIENFMKDAELNNKAFMQVNVDWLYSEC